MDVTDGPSGRGRTAGVAADASAATESLREQVYHRLRDEILNGRVSPRERLTEPKLSRAFSVSRTPVREALSRLLSDGLVERTDFGYAVVVPSLASLRDLYELRVTLELRGIARAVENPQVRHDRALLGAELERWRGLRADPPAPGPGFVVLDEGFHRTLSQASGNPHLTDALVAVNQRIRLARMHAFLEAERIAASVDEHIEILDLVLTDRLDEALTALHRHVGESLDVVAQRAAHAMARMTVAG